MKRLFPLIIIAVLGIAATTLIIPGCDELVTKENFYYDTHYDTTIVYEADTTCGLCHHDATDSISIAGRQWTFSAHASDSLTAFDYLGNNTSNCGPECHSNEGFVDYVMNGSASALSFATEIGCFSCHAPHTNRDFSLRTTEFVALEAGSNYSKGNSNICAVCHKSTLQAPTQAANTITMDSTWGPHFSTQADMLLGTGGYEFEAPLTITNPHYSNNTSGCLACHQSVADGFTLGGHSNNLDYNGNLLVDGCNVNGCHESVPIEFFDFSVDQAAVADSLDSAWAIMIDSGWVNADSSLKDTVLPRDAAGSIFNYLFIKGDGSGGSHNLEYAKALIDSTMIFLRTGVVPGSQ